MLEEITQGLEFKKGLNVSNLFKVVMYLCTIGNRGKSVKSKKKSETTEKKQSGNPPNTKKTGGWGFFLEKTGLLPILMCRSM